MPPVTGAFLPSDVAHVLTVAAHTAERGWDRERCDIYHCVSKAWRATGMRVPHAAVADALRAHLRRTHPGMSVLGLNDSPRMNAPRAAGLLSAAAADIYATDAALPRIHPHSTGTRPRVPAAGAAAAS